MVRLPDTAHLNNPLPSCLIVGGRTKLMVLKCKNVGHPHIQNRVNDVFVRKFSKLLKFTAFCILEFLKF